MRKNILYALTLMWQHNNLRHGGGIDNRHHHHHKKIYDSRETKERKGQKKHERYPLYLRQR